MRISRRLLLATVVTAVIAISGLAVGCESLATDEVETYSDPTYGFSFEYPADWQLAAADNAGATAGAEPAVALTIGDPDGTTVGNAGVDLMMIRVYKLTRVVDEEALPQLLPVLEELIADLQSQDPTWEVEEPPKETMVAGMPAYEYTSTFDWDAKTPMKTTSYFLFAGNIEYQLVVQAAAKTWDEHQDEFAAFLASFKPGDFTVF